MAQQTQNNKTKTGNIEHKIPTPEKDCAIWNVLRKMPDETSILKWKILIIDDRIKVRPKPITSKGEAKDIDNYYKGGDEETFNFKKFIEKLYDEIKSIESITTINNPRAFFKYYYVKDINNDYYLEIVENNKNNTSDNGTKLNRPLMYEIDDYDIIFLDNIFSSETIKDYGIQKILPEIQKRRHINKFPLVILLTGAYKTPSDGNYYKARALQQGADWFLDKNDLITEENNTNLLEVICNALVVRYWKLDKSFNEIDINEALNVFNKGNIQETEYILQKIFSDAEDISKLKILGKSSGLSGAKLAIVQPQKKDGTEILPRFVKIQDKDKLVNEKYAYDKRIKGLIDNFCGRIETPIAVTDNFAGIAYTGVGTIDDYKNGRVPEQFDGFINNKSLNQIKDSLSIIFRTILSPLYQEIIPGEKIHELKSRYFYRKFFPVYGEIEKLQPGEKEFEIVRRKGNDVIVRYVNIEDDKEDKEDNNRDFYKSYKIKNFPDNILIRPGKKIKLKVDDKILKGKIEETLNKKIFGEDFEKDLKLISENSKEKFIRNLQKYINKAKMIKVFKIEDPISKLDEVDGICNFKIRRSCIHGDLNLQNILFTTITDTSGKESFNFWLTDFADTIVGPTCFDFVKMEVEIRLQFLPRVLFNKKMEHKWEEGNFSRAINYFIDCERDLNSSIFKNISENDSTKIWHNDEDISKYYLVMSYLRQIAREFGITKIEYFMILYYYSLAYLKFDEVEMDQTKNPSAPLPRIMAYFTSAVAFEFIKMENKNEK